MWTRPRTTTARTGNTGSSDATVDAFARAIGAASSVKSFQVAVLSGLLHVSQGRSAFYLGQRASDGAYVLEATSGDPNPPLQEGFVLQAASLTKWLRANDEPLFVGERDAVTAYLSPAEQSMLQDLGVSVCVPLMINHRLAAVILIGGDHETPRESLLMPSIRRCAVHAAITADAVARRQAEYDRQEAELRAQQLAMVGQMAAAVAHEVRNPLATIRSGVQYVADSPADWSRKTTVLQSIVGEVDRINRTLSSMLGLSRPEPLEMVETDVEELVENALLLMRPYLDHQQLTLKWSGRTRRVLARVDRRQLHQVLLNVLLNACQAMQQHGQIAVAVETADQTAIVIISDTGSGITSENLERVFVPLFSTKPNGTGLGLAICRDIMARLGGSIGIESQLGVGTTVRLSLHRPIA